MTYREPSLLFDICSKQGADHRGPDDGIGVVDDGSETGTGDVGVVVPVFEQAHRYEGVLEAAVRFPKAEDDECHESCVEGAQDLA